MATPKPVCIFKHVKHGTQNIQNDCHQWLSDSIRVPQIRFLPDSAGGAYITSPDPLAGLRGAAFKGTGKRGEKIREGEKKERGGSAPPLTQIPGSAGLRGPTL